MAINLEEYLQYIENNKQTYFEWRNYRIDAQRSETDAKIELMRSVHGLLLMLQTIYPSRWQALSQYTVEHRDELDEMIDLLGYYLQIAENVEQYRSDFFNFDFDETFDRIAKHVKELNDVEVLFSKRDDTQIISIEIIDVGNYRLHWYLYPEDQSAIVFFS